MSLQHLGQVMQTHKRSDDPTFPSETCVECSQPYPCGFVTKALGKDAA